MGQTLFDINDDAGEPVRGHSTGILPASQLRAMMQRGRLVALREIEESQILTSGLAASPGASGRASCRGRTCR
jgi:hypothetical protein